DRQMVRSHAPAAACVRSFADGCVCGQAPEVETRVHEYRVCVAAAGIHVRRVRGAILANPGPSARSAKLPPADSRDGHAQTPAAYPSRTASPSRSIQFCESKPKIHRDAIISGCGETHVQG